LGAGTDWVGFIDGLRICDDWLRPGSDFKSQIKNDMNMFVPLVQCGYLAQEAVVAFEPIPFL
jgi:hypothetical protein